MRLLWSAYFCTIVMVCALTFSGARADGGPFLGKSTCPVHVNVPTEANLLELDNGFLLDQACSTIYVRPPVRGKFQLSGIAKSGSLGLCSAYNNIHKAFTNVNAQLVSASSPGGDISKIPELLTVNDALWQQLGKFDDVPGLTGAALLSIEWAKLTKSYHDLNPDLQVRPIPLSGSYLTYAAKGADAPTVASVLSTLENQERLPALISAKIPGLKPIDLNVSLESPSTDPSLLFGESLGGQIVLSLHGACPFYNGKDVTLNGDAMESLYPYIVSNVQYFYPVQISSSYKIEVNADVVADWLSSVLVEGTTFSNRKVTDKLFSLQGQNGYKIEIDDADFTQNASAFDLTEAKREITQTFVYSILNKLADPIATLPFPEPSVVPPNDPYYEVTANGVQCRTIKFIGITVKRDCSNVTYKIRQATNGQAFGKEEIRKAISATSLGSVVHSYFVMQRGSLSFIDADAKASQ